MQKPDAILRRKVMRPKRIGNVLVGMFLLMLSSSSLATWASRAGAMQVRSLPLDLSRSGVEVTRQLFVSEERTYAFRVGLKFKDGDLQGLDRLQGLARDPRGGRDSSFLKAGVAIPLRVKISVSQQAGERILVEKDLDQQRLHTASADALWLSIGTIDLSPGFYRLSIKSLKDIAELSQMPATVEISWTRTKEPASQGSAEMMALLAQIRDADLLNNLSSLARFPQGSRDKIFLRAEAFAVPDATGVLNPCMHRVHLHHESGRFLIVRRCGDTAADIYEGVQKGWSANVPSSAQAFVFKPR